MSESTRKATAPDAEMLQFMADLEQGLQEADAGLGRVTTPEQIMARRRGRPAGSVQAITKEPVKIRLDPDVLASFKATGKGWQTRMNDALKDWLRTHTPAH